MYEGQSNEAGETLLLDKWANEPGWRIHVWRLSNGDVRIEFENANGVIDHALTLASYRADDLTKALKASERPF